MSITQSGQLGVLQIWATSHPNSGQRPMMCDFQPETKNNPFPTPNLWAWLAPYDRIPSLIFHPMKSLHSWNWAWTSHKFDYMKTWGISVWMQNFRLFSSEEKWGSPCDHMELAKPINWELQFGKSEQIGKFGKSTVILSSKVTMSTKSQNMAGAAGGKIYPDPTLARSWD